MDLYISGPMTGYPDYNYPAFHAAARHLRGMGLSAFNPAENFDGDQTLDFHDYMREDLEEVLHCLGVVALEGWEHSKGARIEILMATAIGTPVYLYDSEDEHWTLPTAETLEVDDIATFLADLEPVNDEEDYLDDPEDDPESPLQEANRLVTGARQDDYGHPYDDFSKTAKMWSAIFGVDIRPEQVAMAMICVKISRQLNAPKRDNIVDGIGYWQTLHMVQERRDQLENDARNESKRAHPAGRRLVTEKGVPTLRLIRGLSD